VLRPFALIPSPPETTLRLLPLGFGLLTLWAAHRTGRDLAGELGGLLALAVVALDHTSIGWAKTLKQYSAEAFLGVVAFHLAARFAATGQRRDLVLLSISLAIGAAIGATQLLVAPPLLASLLADALVRRDFARSRAVLVAAATITVWDVAYFELVVAPHLTPALEGYWANAYVPSSPVPAAHFVVRSLVTMLSGGWSVASLVVGLVSLVTLAGRRSAARPAIAALVLLVAEAAAVSAHGRLPFDAPRVMLFLLTIVHVHLAAGVGCTFGWLSSRGWSRPLAAVVLGVVLHGFLAHRAWRDPGEVVDPEDLGPLVRMAEAERRPGDAVLVYARSVYVFAYYQARPPVLAPAPTTVGFVPVPEDPDVLVIDGPTADAAIARAFAGHDRAWFLGSRFHEGDVWRIRSALLAHGHIVRELARARSLLLLATR
jgi:hypothetical protein